MYAAVSLGKVSAEKPIFFAVNAVGAVLVLVGASHQFDIGDTGTIGQELIWAGISIAGGVRAWVREGGPRNLHSWMNRAASALRTQRSV
jgi:hypothetical protein